MSFLPLLSLSPPTPFLLKLMVFFSLLLLHTYGGLNRNGPHRFMCLTAWPKASGTIIRHGLVGVDVALLEEMSHWGGGF